MNKYVLFGLIIGWLLFATFVVDAFDAYLDTDEFGVINPIDQIETDGSNEASSVRGFIRTFTSALTLQITGLPAIVSLILFGVPTFILAFMTLDLMIKFLQVIIPF